MPQQQLEYSSPPPAAQIVRLNRRTWLLLAVVGLIVAASVISFARAQEIRLTSIPSHGRGNYLLLLNGIAYLSVYPSTRFDPGWRMDEQRRSPGYGFRDFRTVPEQVLFRYARVGVHRPGASQVIVSFPLIFAALPMLFLLRRRVSAVHGCGITRQCSGPEPRV